MQADKVLRAILAREGFTPIQASRKIGKNPNYLAVLFTKGTIPKVSTYSEICYQLGYELIARSINDGYEFHIDPPE